VRPARICLIGGIFDKPPEYRAAVTSTPETVLASGLRERGHDVVELGHRARHELDGFDVVHVHHLARGAVAAASVRAPAPLAFTGHWLRQPTPSRRAAMRYVVARAGAVVALSKTEADWQRATYPALAGRQHTIPNGIDDATFVFHPPRAPAAGEPWRLLYVGQLARFKGVSFLLQALARLDPALAVELDLVYQVDTEEAALRGEAEQLGLRGVRFLGARNPGELAGLYADAHALVLPSTGEALPSVISEALMVGRPVVGTDVGAVREQVGDFGRVVPPRDVAALADAIAGVLGDHERHADDAERASRRAVECYSVTAMVGAHERMYERLAAGKPRGRSSVGSAVDACVRLALGARSRT
jgi:glycosyltransferase involved in cell wall biosynthesis